MIFQDLSISILLDTAQCYEIFASGFFHESSSPKPLKINWGSFQICSKIRRDIPKSGFTTIVNDIDGKFATRTTGLVNTNGNFATGC
jgi:hypothetical protein